MSFALMISFPIVLFLAAGLGFAVHLGNPVVIGITGVALAGACTGVLLGWYTSRPQSPGRHPSPATPPPRLSA